MIATVSSCLVTVRYKGTVTFLYAIEFHPMKFTERMLDNGHYGSDTSENYSI